MRIRPDFYRYFLALRPGPEAVALIMSMIGLVGAMRSPLLARHYHLTLAVLAETGTPDHRWHDRIGDALDDHALLGCEIALRRLLAAPGVAMLLTAGRQDGLRALHAGLFRRLGDHGIEPRRRKAFRPHLTLGYGPETQSRRMVAPILWQAVEIVLIESHVGLQHHNTLGHWPLLPPMQRAFDFS